MARPKTYIIKLSDDERTTLQKTIKNILLQQHWQEISMPQLSLFPHPNIFQISQIRYAFNYANNLVFVN